MIGARPLAVVLSQAGAALGFGVTGFAVGTWVLQQTHETAGYTLLASASALPGVVLAPFAGAVAERFAASRVLIAANLCALVSTLALFACVRADVAPGPHLALLLVISGIGFGLQWPAWGKAMTTLVPPQHLRTAAALLQLGTVSQYVLAPAVAGALIGVTGTAGLLLLDAALLVAAVVTAGLVRTPVVGAASPVIAGVVEAWRALRAQPGLLSLQLFFCVSFFFGGTSVALTTPLYLSITDPRTAGLLLSLSGTGMLLGVGGAIAFGFRHRRGRAVIVLEGVAGVALAFIAVSPTPLGLTLVSIAFLAATAVSAATSQAVWHETIPAALQVRVFALRRMIAWGALPLGYLTAGHAADVAAVALGSATRGIAAVFVVAGVGKALVSLAWLRSPAARLD